jgi:hypothetical protein
MLIILHGNVMGRILQAKGESNSLLKFWNGRKYTVEKYNERCTCTVHSMTKVTEKINLLDIEYA